MTTTDDQVPCPLRTHGTECVHGCVLCASTGSVPAAMAVEFELLELHPRYAIKVRRAEHWWVPIHALRKRYGLMAYEAAT